MKRLFVIKDKETGELCSYGEAGDYRLKRETVAAFTSPLRAHYVKDSHHEVVEFREVPTVEGALQMMTNLEFLNKTFNAEGEWDDMTLAIKLALALRSKDDNFLANVNKMKTWLNEPKEDKEARHDS